MESLHAHSFPFYELRLISVSRSDKRWIKYFIPGGVSQGWEKSQHHFSINVKCGFSVQETKINCICSHNLKWFNNALIG